MGRKGKTEVINFRVSSEQKQMIRNAAEHMGMDISKYLLYLASHREIVVVEGGKELAREVYQLNQKLNRLERYPFVDVQELRDVMSDGISRIIKAKEGI